MCRSMNSGLIYVLGGKTGKIKMAPNSRTYLNFIPGGLCGDNR